MPKPLRAEAPSRAFSVKMSPEERGRYQLAARRNQQTLTAFLRDAAAEAATDCLEPEERDQAIIRRGRRP